MKMNLLKGILGSLLGGAALMLLAPSAYSQGYYYTQNFEGARNLEAVNFTTIDSNGDGKTWALSGESSFANLDGVTDYDHRYTKYPVYIDTNNNDDWLLTPSIRFEAGKTYKTTIIFCKTYYANPGQVLEVKLGTAKNAASMTTTLLAPSDINIPEYGGNSLWTHEFVISVPTTGDYYLGVHAIGQPAVKVGLTDINIENGISLVTPAAPTDFEFTHDATDAKKVTVSFKAPDKAKDGSTLNALTKIEVRRNGDLVSTIDNPTPGTRQYVDNIVAVSGVYTYTAQAFTASGGGDLASATTFVGINTPSSVKNVVARNTGSDKANISWEAPTLDKDGYPIIASILTYDVYRTPLYSSEATLVASDVAGLSCDDLIEADEDAAEPFQQFYTYSVVAKSSEGSAPAVSSNPLPLGDPYAVPYLESFPRGRASNIFTSTSLAGNTRWSLTNSLDDVTSVDGDGIAYLDGQIGGVASCFSGLIDLTGMVSPTLSYYTYNIAGADPADNELEIVITATDGTSKTIARYSPDMYWNKSIVPLTEFADKVIRINFNGYRNNNTYLCLDAIEVTNIFAHDLKVTGMSVPAKVHTDEPFNITVDVLNAGSVDSGDYTVELYCDGAKVDTYGGTSLKVGDFDHVSFTRTHGILDAEKAVYSAKVIYANDQDNSNNESDEVETTIVKNSYPVVEDLTGAVDGSNITLTWSEPNTENARPYEVVEDFERYDSWANSGVGDWVFVDQDKAVIAGFNNGEEVVEMPGIPSYSQQSWWVFDNSTENFNNGSFETLSGRKFLASMISGIQGEGVVQNDDWAISPRLYGGPQTITVNARSYSLMESEFETFEVLYSTGSTNPADFTSVRIERNIPGEFNAYEFDLPDGAKRFAIRNISNGKMMLMVDDVVYTPEGDPAAFSINGYNVYRDGVKINTAPVEENEFTDINVPEGKHVYNVTVIYSAGESMFSNDWSAKGAEVTDITVEDGEMEFFNLQGIRVLNPERGQIYIVRKGNSVNKVIIR